LLVFGLFKSFSIIRVVRYRVPGTFRMAAEDTVSSAAVRGSASTGLILLGLKLSPSRVERIDGVLSQLHFH